MSEPDATQQRLATLAVSPAIGRRSQHHRQHHRQHRQLDRQTCLSIPDRDRHRWKPQVALRNIAGVIAGSPRPLPALGFLLVRVGVEFDTADVQHQAVVKWLETSRPAGRLARELNDYLLEALPSFPLREW